MLTDRASENQILLAIEDKPGLLHQLSRYFRDEGINLTSLHTFRTPNGYYMRINLGCKRSAPEAEHTIRAIIADGLATLIS